MHMYLYMCICAYVYMYMCIKRHAYSGHVQDIYIYIYVCIQKHIDTVIDAYIYTDIYIYIHIRLFSFFLYCPHLLPLSPLCSPLSLCPLPSSFSFALPRVTLVSLPAMRTDDDSSRPQHEEMSST